MKQVDKITLRSECEYTSSGSIGVDVIVHQCLWQLWDSLYHQRCTAAQSRKSKKTSDTKKQLYRQGIRTLAKEGFRDDEVGEGCSLLPADTSGP